MSKITSINLDNPIYRWVSEKADKEHRSISGQVRHMLKIMKDGENNEKVAVNKTS